MNSNSVCCIFVTYNPPTKFMNNFNVIVEQVEKVVIVDNGSNSENVEMLNELSLNNNVELILNHDNLGIAKALNLGVKYAIERGYKWILTMDHDSTATEDMVEIMLNKYNSLKDEEKEKIGSLFPKFIEKGLISEDNHI